MGKPVLTLIQGGKSESGTDFAQAFAEAGLASDDGLIDYDALFKLIDENRIVSPPAPPVPFFLPDEDGDFGFRFL
jgi:hypothetical protein